MATETFGQFLTSDNSTPALPLPVLANDRLGVSRDGISYFLSALAIAGGVPALVTVTPSSGDTVTMNENTRALYVNTAALDSLTFLLPPDIVVGDVVDISFAASISTMLIKDSNANLVLNTPTSAYGPGGGMQFRYVSDVIGWVYWR